MMWLILDMDEGVIRREKSRRAAVAWLINHVGGAVQWRRTYGPGVYEYRVGPHIEDCAMYFVETQENAVRGSWEHWFSVPDLYPYPDRPHVTDNDLDRDVLIEAMWKELAT
jgi:hypothetical protein